MENSDYLEGLAYSNPDSPDMESISRVYQHDLDSHTGFADQVADGYNQRRMWWAGKTLDQRKHALDAKPWRFASDAEVPVIDPRINALVAICMNAVRSGQISATPIGAEDAEASAVRSKFVRWMIDCWIPNSYDNIEMSLQNMFEKGIAATWCGWEKSSRVHKESFNLDDMLAAEQEAMAEGQEITESIAEIFSDKDREDEAIEILQQQFESVNVKRAKKALKQLRETGVAEIPVVKADINRPTMVAKCPRADIILPQYATDVKDVDRLHIRHFMSIQDLRSAVANQGWDEEWFNEVVESGMGVTQQEIDGLYGNRDANLSNQQATLFNLGNRDAEDLVEIVETFQRQVDKEDGAIGFYRTIWCPKKNRNDKEGGFGVHELLNGWDEFPVAITTMSRDASRIYDQRNACDLLRGNQRLQKVTRDAFVDQLSLSMNPPRTHPAGRPQTPWGAGASSATRRGEEGLYRTLDIPDTSNDGMRFSEYLDAEADKIMGLSANDPISAARQQYYVNRALAHVSECARLNYKGFQRFYEGPDIHFRVTGSPDPQKFNVGSMDEDLDVKLFYDVRNMDNEFVKESIKSLMDLKASDMNGDFDSTEIMRIAAYMTVPQFADRILRPVEEAQADIEKDVAEDLTMIWAGNNLNARQTGAQTALGYIERYTQQQNVQKRMNEDEEYANALEAYIQQYQFQIQQQQNAMTGRLGTQQQDINPK